MTKRQPQSDPSCAVLCAGKCSGAQPLPAGEIRIIEKAAIDAGGGDSRSGRSHHKRTFRNRQGAFLGHASATGSNAAGTTLTIADHRSIVADIGTAQECFPVLVAQAHRHILAKGFDLPQLRDVFETYVQNNGLSDRIHFFPGSFFQDELPRADVLVFGRVGSNPSPILSGRESCRYLPSSAAVAVAKPRTSAPP